MKIRPLGAELFLVDGHTDGQTDMKNLIVAFRNFAKGTMKGHSSCVHTCVRGLG